MLYVDLSLSDQELARQINDMCAEYGTVLDVRIERGPVIRAVIEMAAPIDAVRVRRDFGNSLRGVYVTVELSHRAS